MSGVRHLARWGYGLTRRLIQDRTLPSAFWKAAQSISVDIAGWRCPERWSQLVKPSSIIVGLSSPDSARDHVDELYADAHVARREEQAFDEIGVV